MAQKQVKKTTTTSRTDKTGTQAPQGPELGGTEDLESIKEQARSTRQQVESILARSERADGKGSEVVNEARVRPDLRDREAEDEEFVNAFIQQTGE